MGNKYQKIIHGASIVDLKTPQLASIDVYDVLAAFEVNDPAIQHAVKKLLAAGQRGAKDRRQDLREAISSIDRSLENLERRETYVPPAVPPVAAPPANGTQYEPPGEPRPEYIPPKA